ncbi:BREX-1 system adenine-specific DNA-methyltransferase PglX [Alkalibacillus haloalkaliphilus]|uniref:BREX-1 system adenine-specific DNA-methyltransferase PglX n=1 Tax=Alkalibacillus haloalkaliphilus TaxID=94136 RepID=UPI002935821D|nr:BREX-1 system adenine-specific DNA-methyltransferase PglX [Alkalibacillus haloalkaliphilus]MDV2581666.1 BREX-1 system adenine-specific DNA-methyltransferase PglX [Alkalibacillus haloalkaliphilus]
MNKSSLRSFATNARRELLEKVQIKARKIGITEDKIKQADVESSDAVFIDGRQLSAEEKKQRQELIKRIEQKGFNQVMEEVAYTWFNRFTALRFMEVNEYLPSDVRVLSSSNPEDPIPDIIKEALSLDFDIDKEWVYERKLNNENDKLFQYLIIKQCNDLYDYLPFMFEKIDDYTEILFPEGLLSKGSFLREMTNTDVIAEEDWTEVEIIGWLYQYYISEEKDRVIHAKKKYNTEEIPFATQLFTPDWIVRYMVQNSLGRYWIENHPEDRELIDNWEFYLENPNPDEDFEEKLAPYLNKDLKVEDIKCFDPAMGSGHILVYMFDVLYEIYRKCGYQENEIPRKIIENNLYGLDIDDRAYQLASFSIVMKAMKYNKLFLRNIKRNELIINLASIQETNDLNDDDIAFIVGDSEGAHYENAKEFIRQFTDAKTLGALIKVNEYEKDFLLDRLSYIQNNPARDIFEEVDRNKVIKILPNLLKQAEIMEQKYDITVTNPPYLGNRYMPNHLSDYIVKNYSYGKTDIFLSFIEFVKQRTKSTGHMGFLTPYVWLFLSSYEKFRQDIVGNHDISSLIQLEYNSFEVAVVPVCTFTLRNYNANLSGEFIKLTDFKGVKNQPVKTLEAIKNPTVSYRYSKHGEIFKDIEGFPIAYWVSDNIRKAFKKDSVKNYADLKKGLSTGNNQLFLRNWFEVNNKSLLIKENINDVEKIEPIKWAPIKKGGPYRKWYGNQEEVVYWENNGEKIKEYSGSVIRNPSYYFKESISWTMISNSKLGMRYYPDNFIFEGAGPSIFPREDLTYVLLAFLCSKLATEFRNLLNPTMNINIKDIENLPFLHEEISEKKSDLSNLAKDSVDISKNDWDSFEISWNFKYHPFFIEGIKQSTLEQTFDNWSLFREEQFNKLKSNEEKINKILIDIYGFEDELTPEVQEEDITISLSDKIKDVRSFISYAIGCSFGRYSLDREGLVYAGGEFDFSKYQKFKVDGDNILPIVDGPYFEDDIVSRFIDFVKVTFSEETLEENLDFIADALGRRKNETARETIRRYFLNEFFKDHVQTYKKRPIYWQFTSGKHKAFNCLVYMHRFDPTLLGRIRTDYLHEVQTRMDAEKEDLLTIIEGDSTSKERNQAKKDLETLEKKIEELKAYDEKLHHMADQQIDINLDDGVEENYAQFKDLLVKK